MRKIHHCRLCLYVTIKYQLRLYGSQSFIIIHQHLGKREIPSCKVLQVVGTGVVLLVGLPYIIIFKVLTSSEDNDKYKQAHRWFHFHLYFHKGCSQFHVHKVYFCFQAIVNHFRFIGYGYVALAAPRIFIFMKSYPLRCYSKITSTSSKASLNGVIFQIILKF